MEYNKYISENFGISEEVVRLVRDAEKDLEKQFKKIDETAEFNQLKVMKAFADNKVSEAHFVPTTGYAEDDLGRDTLDKVYAQVFGAEDAIVRHNFVSGTHTLATMLFAVLRPGDTLLAVTGKPYDTLEETIGISGEDGNGSLKDFGVKYMQADLKADGQPDLEKIKKILTENEIKVAEIQRSRGYGVRPSYSAEEIGDLISFIKNVSPQTICVVDNCYGEFADTKEPTDFGADLMAGSLIKNPGGGLALTGGYIAGKSKYVELCAYRLTAVGIGRHSCASIGMTRNMYQGFFMSPHTTAQAIKTALLCAAVFEKMGYGVSPSSKDERHDIIQSVILGSPEKITAFCEGIQKGAPVDSFVKPQPWEMPGYSDKVIMAAGGFVQGASIELSADAPMRPPYVVYMQGGLTYESAKLGIMSAAQRVTEQQ